jgi:hypothetical protein
MRRYTFIALVVVLVLAFAAPALAKGSGVAAGHKHYVRKVDASGYPLPRFVFLSHPVVAKQRNKINTDFRTWGYISPRSAITTDTTVTIVISKWNGKRSWTPTASVVAALSNSTKWKHQTKYKATVNLGATGRYRMRAVFSWVGSDGKKHVKRSSFCYFRIVK